MVANDDLEGKTTHFTGFYAHTISGPNIPKPPIVYVMLRTPKLSSKWQTKITGFVGCPFNAGSSVNANSLSWNFN